MGYILYLFNYIYAYCTDFIINLSNFTGLSYYEVNFFIFIIIYPLLIVGAPTFYFIQLRTLRKLEKSQI